jgi:hypothetical protein
VNLLHRLCLVVAILAAAAALAIPPLAVRVVQPPVAAAAVRTGPVTLAQAWPSAVVTSINGALPDGTSYRPVRVIDATTSVGLVTTPDGTTTSFGISVAGRPLRVLHTMQGMDAPTVTATAAANGFLYWLEFSTDSRGGPVTTVWRTSLAAATAPKLLATDRTELIFFDSQYDLELANGRLWWAAYGTGRRGEIRSVAVTGGTVTGTTYGATYVLSTWPWLVAFTDGQAGPVQLFNPATSERLTVSAQANQFLSCTPTWCRITNLIDQGTSVSVDLEHPDGTHLVHLNPGTPVPLNTDVALLDRFEVVGSVSKDTANGNTQSLFLHDLTTGREILLDAAATGTVSSRDGILWWSVGDNETLDWQVLDLHQLH